MEQTNNSKSNLLYHKSEDKLQMHLPETTLLLSLDETITLVQKLEANQLKILALKKKLRLAKEQTQDSIQKYNELFDLTTLGYFILSRYSEIIEINASCSHILGKEPIYLANSNFRSFVTDKTKPIFDIFLRNAFCSQTDEIGEVTLVSGDNLPIYVHLSGHIMKNGEECMVSMVDITERKQSEKKLKLLSRAMEQSPVTVVITDKEGNIRYTNPKFTEITGYTLVEVMGQNLRFLQTGAQSSEFYKELWETILSGNDWHGEFQNRKKNGDLYWESAVISSIVNDSGDIAYFIGVKEDITEKKQMIADLVKAKEKAEESDRLKSAFLANMSHEIRTPLNSIVGFAELLNDPEFDLRQKKEFTETIMESSNNLLTIVSDIMDLSMMEAGQLKIRKDKLSIKKLFTELEHEFGKKAVESGPEIHINIPSNCDDVVIETDAFRIRQILNNLIGNALKFTSQGFVEIGYLQRKDCIEFMVKDSGIGIAAQNHHAIFERFRQVEYSNSRNFGGNGLGLAISKNLVEILGGEIWVESEEGKGSTFYFTISTQTENNKENSINPESPTAIQMK